MNRRTQFILLLVLELFCEAKLSKKKWDRVENKLNTVLEKMIRKFQEIREGHGKYVNNNNDSLIIMFGLCKFHLFLAINKALPEDREDYFNDIDNVIKTCKVEIEEVFQKGSSENGLEKDRNKLNKMVQDGIRNIAKHISESKGLGKKSNIQHTL